MIKLITILLLSFGLVRSQVYPYDIKQAYEKFISHETGFNTNHANRNLQNEAMETLMNTLKDLNELDSLTGPLPNISTACLMEVLTLGDGVKNSKTWAISFLDSLGKPPSGIFQGNLDLEGDYHECLSIPKTIYDPRIKFTTRFCQIGKPAQPALITINSKFGVCIPGECNPYDLVEIFNYAVDQLPKNITKFINVTHIDSSYINCATDTPSFDTKAIFAMVVCFILVAVVLAGTIYDIYGKSVSKYEKKLKGLIPDDEEKLLPEEKKEEPILFQILLCFSIYTNSKKLFTTTKVPGQIDCLHGIRFLSISWVILGHSYLFTNTVVSNPAELFIWKQRFSFQIIANALFSVDSFFMLSGLLTSFLFLKEAAKKGGKITMPVMIYYYVHRFWRLTPPYMLVIMVFSCLTKYMRSGPNFPIEGFEPFCKDSWWANLLYINNFVKLDQQCLPVSWYLANDMQFHWIAPIFLIPFALGQNNRIFKYIGYGLSSLMLVINMIVIALILNAHPGLVGADSVLDLDFFKLVYIKPWCRIGPFIIGILLGYALHTCKDNPDFKLSNIQNMIGWILSLFTLGLMLFGLYSDNNPNYEDLNKVEHILYQASSRTLWAIGLAFIVFSCTLGKGGIVNHILSWSVWIPLSRLSFCAYLIHLDFITFYGSILERKPFNSDINAIYFFIGHIFVSYFGAFFVSMIFEVPLLGLEKIIYRKK